MVITLSVPPSLLYSDIGIIATTRLSEFEMFLSKGVVRTRAYLARQVELYDGFGKLG